jgi:hypothetical protein
VDKRQPMRLTQPGSHDSAAAAGVWKCQVLLPTNKETAYKYVMQAPGTGDVTWENGDNRILDLTEAGDVALIRGTWRR